MTLEETRKGHPPVPKTYAFPGTSGKTCGHRAVDPLVPEPLPTSDPHLLRAVETPVAAVRRPVVRDGRADRGPRRPFPCVPTFCWPGGLPSLPGSGPFGTTVRGPSVRPVAPRPAPEDETPVRAGPGRAAGGRRCPAARSLGPGSEVTAADSCFPSAPPPRPTPARESQGQRGGGQMQPCGVPRGPGPPGV